MDNTFNWRPESLLLKKLLIVANQQDRSPEAIVTEAVKLYIETQQLEIKNTQPADPLIGLFKGSPNLAISSEDILQEDIRENSGWTWKKI